MRYIGGLTCCRHLRYLLDADQEQPWKGDVLEYHLKYRFYFQECPAAQRSRDAPRGEDL